MNFALPKLAVSALLASCATGGVAASPVAAQADADPAFQALEWRNLGPFNGGRGTSVVGHPTEPFTFFFGHSSGGLWRTDDAGAYWSPVGEGQFRYASVGAVAISESKPDVMYVGLGEPQMRQSVSWGDGVYKSIDGGTTWNHTGLSEARQIARVRIHPENPDVVYVASMGHAWGPNEERGVFRTKDGGLSWERVLYISEGTGCIDLAMSASDPNVLVAAMWEFERKAWGAKTAGPESGLYRSMDGGDTWEEISENAGLPEGTMGRIGVAMSKAAPDRVYALVDSETKQGLYRSDDLGSSWRFVSDFGQIIARPFYFYHLFADQSDPDRLWAPANKLWTSADGGENWVLEPGAKDDFQDVWVDPNDSNRMIATCDGGTQVSLTGGLTWSTFANQSGVQFYRVDTDDQFPYRVYGNAQDLLTYSVPSSSRWGGIALYETDFIGNGETGRAIPHPTRPEIVYSLSTGCFYGMAAHFTINNLVTGQNEVRSIWPEPKFGTPAWEFKYRFNWQAPFLISPHDPETIYMGANVVFRSRDEGMTWERISDDLTLNLEDKMQVAGAPWMPEYFGQETFSTIHRLVESPHEQGVLWAGSDDGLIHLTRDGGASWKNVTPPDLPELAGVYEIEVSPHDPSTAYVAITRYRKADDYSPYLLRTRDYGETWARIDSTFPGDEITRTIREDTVRRGLLFVGTETGIYMSIDEGGEWRRLNLNMPALPVHDIEVKGADLVIATHGRGFWILDNIGPIRDYDPNLADARSHLFQPEDHTRYGYCWWMDYGGGPASDKKYYFVRHAVGGTTFYERGVVNGERRREFIDAGDARPQGVLIDYLLREDAEEVSLTILDDADNEIRTFGVDQIPMQRFTAVGTRGYGYEVEDGPPRPTVSRGLNRFVWDMRYPTVPAIPGLPPVVINPIATPGTYKVRLDVDGESQTRSFELKMNPNESYSRAQTDEKREQWMRLQDKAAEGVQAVLRARSIKEEIEQLIEAAPANRRAAIEQEAAKVLRLCTEFEGSLVATGTTLVQIISEPSKPLSKLVMLHNVMETSEGPPNGAWLEVFGLVTAEMDASFADFQRQIGPAMEELRTAAGR